MSQDGLSEWMSNERYEHRICGAHPQTVHRLRHALRSSSFETECQGMLLKVAELLNDNTAGLAVGTALGKVYWQLIEGIEDVVLFFVLDVVDIDTKQITFVRRQLPNKELLFKHLYKADLSNGV
eukprot:GILJ01001788.1.p1 GENE.GILJ01001788.1~~GILJ01001788.1.p1  ORF type:complete len:124 (-),score=12.95 GILJ01001788.1:373-744(-)